MTIFVTKFQYAERDKEKSGDILSYVDGFRRGRSRQIEIAVEK